MNYFGVTEDLHQGLAPVKKEYMVVFILSQLPIYF